MKNFEGLCKMVGGVLELVHRLLVMSPGSQGTGHAHLGGGWVKG